MKLTHLAPLALLATSVAAQSSIERVYYAEAVAVDTEQYTPGAQLRTRTSITPAPFTGVVRNPSVRATRVVVESSWESSLEYTYTNTTGAPLSEYRPFIGQDAALIYGNQASVAAGCDGFYEQGSGPMVTVQPGDTFTGSEGDLFRTCCAAANSTGTGWQAQLWQLLEPVCYDQPQAFGVMANNGQYNINFSTLPGLAITGTATLTQRTTKAVTVEMDEIVATGQVPCASTPAGHGTTVGLRLYGSMNRGPSNLIVRLDGLPVGQPAFLVVADDWNPMPSATYNLCLRGSRVSQQVAFAQSATTDFEVDLSNVMVGIEVSFQALYRFGGQFGVSELRTETVIP